MPDDGADGYEAEDGSDSDASDELELLRRLGQSQARMEQIKRMLVTQRGFIVQALKQMAECSHQAPGTQTCAKCSQNTATPSNPADAHSKRSSGVKASDYDKLEKDRTLGSTLKHSATRVAAQPALRHDDALGHEHNHGDQVSDDKLCPMCEAAFPGDVDPEQFESHVVEHFCFEDAETLKYVHVEGQ